MSLTSEFGKMIGMLGEDAGETPALLIKKALLLLLNSGA
jgi:hypothetical protein